LKIFRDFARKKHVVKRFVLLCPKGAKTHLRASVTSKIFPKVIPRTPLKGREGSGKEGEEGWEKKDGDGKEKVREIGREWEGR
jgi:hypothetical protein